MHAIIIFGFMLPVAAIRIWKPISGVDWKTALLTCSANESRLPRVRVTNNSLELVDDIASNISNTFWLGALYETIEIDPFNVSDNDLRFPRVCCSTFPEFSETCMDSCISCNANHAYKCKISQQNDNEGAGPWIVARRLCSNSTWTRGNRGDTYWNQDIRRLSLNFTSSGQAKDTCTYFCAGSVLIRECSDSSGVDTVCVTDKVENLYPSNTSTVSTHVSTEMGNSSLEYTDGTLSTHFSTNTIQSTEDSTSKRTHMTEGILSTQSITNTERSTDDSTSIHIQTTGTFNAYVTSMSTQVTTFGITAPNTVNTMSITKEDPNVFVTLIVVMATALIAFVVVLVLYCRLRRASLKSQKSETNTTEDLLFPDFSRRNPIYGVDHDSAVNGDPHRHVSYSDPDYNTASDVSAFPTGASNIERHLPPGSEESSKLGGSMNTDIYARPMKIKRAISPSSDEKQEKTENENASEDSAVYASPEKYGKLRKDSKDAERTIVTLDQKTMEPVEDNVSKTMLSDENNETSEGDYDITYCSSRTLGNETPQNLYDTTNDKTSKPSALINTYL